VQPVSKSNEIGAGVFEAFDESLVESPDFCGTRKGNGGRRCERNSAIAVVVVVAPVDAGERSEEDELGESPAGGIKLCPTLKV
jgi:hypothetical protein